MTAAFAFHFAPTSGWMNDPNGLVERDGVHHLYFQYNPAGPIFGTMAWGHAVSTDLVSWTPRPLALLPGPAGSYDEDGCWSGCAVPTPDGRVAMIYSANGAGIQLPALAISADDDLNAFTKADQLIIASRPDLPGLTDLRDHAMIKEVDGWRQVLAAGRDTSQRPGRPEDERVLNGRGGMILSYRCAGADLSDWTFDGVLLDGREHDLPGEVWECPDLFVGDHQADGQAVLIMSWYTNGEPAQRSDVLWLTGTLAEGRFTPTRYGRLDLGDRFYAPQSYTTSDGRRLMFGWLRTQYDPAAAGRPTVGTASLPRQLGVVDGRLTQQPATELDALIRTPVVELNPDRTEHALSAPASALELGVEAAGPTELAATRIDLVGPDGQRCTLSLAGLAEPSIWLRNGGRNGVREGNGVRDMGREGTWMPETSTDRSARILIDAGLIEIFTDAGRAAAFTDLALPTVSAIGLLEPVAGVSLSVSTLG